MLLKIYYYICILKFCEMKWLAGWMAGCPNRYFYFHFFKAFGIDVIIFYFKILKKN